MCMQQIFKYNYSSKGSCEILSALCNRLFCLCFIISSSFQKLLGQLNLEGWYIEWSSARFIQCSLGLSPPVLSPIAKILVCPDFPRYTAKLSYRHSPQVFRHKSRKTNLIQVYHIVGRILDPSDSYFLFADLVGFYTH